jgi:hypothetical protein
MKKIEAEGDDVIDDDEKYIYETVSNEVYKMSTCQVYGTLK